MSKHTPEPWHVGCDEAMRFTYDTQIVGREGTQTFVMCEFNGNFPDWSRANAKRAVACVNTLAGIPDPAAYIKAMREVVDAATRKIDAERAFQNVKKPNGGLLHDLAVAEAQLEEAVAALRTLCTPESEVKP